MPFLPLPLNIWRLCVNTLVMCFPFSVILKNEGSTSKKCVNQIPNLLQTQDLKKGDLLGKGADAVVSIFLLPGNHKVCSRNNFNFKNNLYYIYIYLYNINHVQELKTKIVKGSANPVFNESFQFGVCKEFCHIPIVLNQTLSPVEVARCHPSNDCHASRRLGPILQKRLNRRGDKTCRIF